MVVGSVLGGFGLPQGSVLLSSSRITSSQEIFLELFLGGYNMLGTFGFDEEGFP
jgi:hypothetical protein